jgi:uncharacterized Zn finger protein
MCKHVAAVLYGIGARLDQRPELLFKLRKVDEKALIAKAGKGVPLSKKDPAAAKVLADDGLSELFGLDLGAPQTKKVTAKKVTAKKKSKSVAKKPKVAKRKPRR